MAIAGSKEARQLEQLKYNFEKVYRENNQSKANAVDKIDNNSHNNLIESGDYDGKHDNRGRKGTDTNIGEGRNTSNINKQTKQSNEQVERRSTDSFESENTLSKSQNEQGTYRIEEEVFEGRNIKRVQITNLDINNIENKVKEIDDYLTKQSESDLRKLKKILNNPNEKVKILLSLNGIYRQYEHNKRGQLYHTTSKRWKYGTRVILYV